MVRKIIDRLLDIVSITLMAALIVVTFLQVVNRYGLQLPVEWTEEIARFLIVWVSLLGAAVCVRESAHIEVDFFFSKMGARLQHYLKILVNICFIAFTIFIIWHGVDILQFIKFQRAAASRISMIWVYLSGPVSGSFIIYYLAGQLIDLLKRKELEQSTDRQVDI